MLLSGFTASCGLMPGASNNNQSAPKPPQSSESPSQQATQPVANNAVTIPPPVAQPPNYGDRPGNVTTSSSAQPTLPNGLPALQAKGVNVDSLFSEQISAPEDRFTRLENAVTDLRREFESFKPAIVRLVAVEADIQDLIEQLDVLLRTEPSPSPAPAAQAPTKLSPEQPIPTVADKPQPTPQTIAKPQVDTSGSPRVSALRVGQHADKLRLVMDVSKKADFTIDLDNQEGLMIIELPNAQWGTSNERSFGKSPLLSSYSTESINNGQGTRVIFTLKKSTRVLKQQSLPPGSNPFYRIYADLSL